MTIFNILLILSIIIIIPSIIWGIIRDWEDILPIIFTVSMAIFIPVMCAISIIQPLQLKNEALRQEKERQQIIYQIQNLDNNKDKIKLNEWILTYNDWVNDVNTEKQIYGWFAWHRDFDMSEHIIIDLV